MYCREPYTILCDRTQHFDLQIIIKCFVDQIKSTPYVNKHVIDIVNVLFFLFRYVRLSLIPVNFELSSKYVHSFSDFM